MSRSQLHSLTVLRRSSLGTCGALIACCLLSGASLAVDHGKTPTAETKAADSTEKFTGGRAVHPGHPTQFDATTLFPQPVGGITPALPVPLPQLAIGPYVNFESPDVKPLAYHAGTHVLVCVNTPNNSIVIFQATPTGLTLLREVPVGLEPVAVAYPTNSVGRRVWVANHISDNIMVVDVATGRITNMVEVGDEPVNILFNASGSTAFVVLQSGQLVALDVGTLAILGSVGLPCNTPRAAVYDAAHQRVIVAALHSGNNTTVVGKTFRAVFFNPATNQNEGIFLPTLWFPQFFAPTSALFHNAAELSPWPDVTTGIAVAAPLVERIVADLGTPSNWKQIIDIFSDDAGNPDPAMMALFDQQIQQTFGLTPVNTSEIFTQVIRDARDARDNDLLVVNVSNPAAMQVETIVGGVGTTLSGMAQNPATLGLFISNKEFLNQTRLEPNLRGHVTDHQIVLVNDPTNSNPGISRLDLHANIPNFNDVTGVNDAAQGGSLADPQDIVFAADGHTAYVVALGSGRVGKLDGNTGEVQDRVDVGRGARGLALNEPDGRLYTFNRTEMSISVVDVLAQPMQVLTTVKLFNPEPAEVRKGRDFLYSTRHSNNFATSCAICHVDSHLDHTAWDLGDPAGVMQPTTNLIGGPDPCAADPGDVSHPLKGPMVTLSLKGLADHNPFHWRGDRPRFTDFNAAFDGLLGGHEIPAADMNAFDAFVKSIVYPPNPMRKRDNTFKNTLAVNGEQHFMNACNVCHQVAHDGAFDADCADPSVGDIGLDLNFLHGQVQEIPQLREIHKKFDSDLYNGFGLLHDGREERETNNHPIETFLNEFFPGFTPEMQQELIAFLDAFSTNVMPVVGLQVRTESVAASTDLQLMIAQHDLSPSRNDVVAKVLINGQMRGFVLSLGGPSPQFKRDDNQTVPLAQVLALASAATPLVFTAVPPGSGVRIGINQDGDAFSDFVDPCPQSRNDGDMNGDGLTNNFDIDAFILALLDPLGFQVQFPDVDYACAGDVNGDGGFNNFDIDPFVQVLLAP